MDFEGAEISCFSSVYRAVDCSCFLHAASSQATQSLGSGSAQKPQRPEMRCSVTRETRSIVLLLLISDLGFERASSSSTLLFPKMIPTNLVERYVVCRASVILLPDQRKRKADRGVFPIYHQQKSIKPWILDFPLCCFAWSHKQD